MVSDLRELTRVMVGDAFVVVRDGKVQGKVSAIYDFSELPTRYHAEVLQLVSQTTTIYDGVPDIEEAARIHKELFEMENRRGWLGNLLASIRTALWSLWRDSGGPVEW